MIIIAFVFVLIAMAQAQDGTILFKALLAAVWPRGTLGKAHHVDGPQDRNLWICFRVEVEQQLSRCVEEFEDWL